MEELLPAATLSGMDDPLTWLQTIEARLVVQPPCAPARWLPPRTAWPRSNGISRLAVSW
jgi:hypothetical protein